MTPTSFFLRHTHSIKVAICATVLLSMTGCKDLPNTPHLPKSIALTQTVLNGQQINQQQTNIAAAFANQFNHDYLKHVLNEQALLHPNLSGYYPITTGANAFTARSILSKMATDSIDVQYYLWHNDEIGQLMLKDLWLAAERGLKIRLLLDDFNNNKQMDALLARFAKHPNIAVRLVNPATYRSLTPMNVVVNPMRTNVRMHNKSITYDHRISIIGGRNIGNEYLNNSTDNQFTDLDVLLVGAVVPQIGQSFNEYWDSPASYDIETLVVSDDIPFLDSLDRIDDEQPIDEQPIDDEQAVTTSKFTANKLSTSQQEHKNDHLKANRLKNDNLESYKNAVKSSTIGYDLLNKQVSFRWVLIDFFGDDAKKLQSSATTDALLVNQLRQAFGMPQQQLTLISSYFVPTQAGVEALTQLARQGITVNILTNSYDATDVGAVHSGYAHYRRLLLDAGVNLYELKSTAKPHASNNNKLWRTQGQTTTSLHAKAFAIDTHKVFIGSYNIDPRSANINTEMGVVIYDDKLTSHFHNAFGPGLLNQAYQVKLNGDSLEWHTLEQGRHTILTSEPNMQKEDKIGIALLSRLPIDWLL